MKRREELPPVISFQSLVDATIRVGAVVDVLYGNLPDNGSELVLFDINRANDIEHFIADAQRSLVDRLANSPAPTTMTAPMATLTRRVSPKASIPSAAAKGSCR